MSKGMQRREKGFTTMELLIVIAIMGIIAAVVIPNVYSFRITGELTAANKELENVKTAALAFHAEYDAWPATSANLTPNLLSGELKATYTFDTDCGWVLNGTGWSRLNWKPGTTGMKGAHGKWIR